MARGASVAEETLREAARKLATWEIKEGCQSEDAKAFGARLQSHFHGF